MKNDQKTRRAGEPEITQGIHFARGVDELRRRLGKTPQEGIEGSGHETGAQAARDAGKRRRDPRERMPARRIEDHAPERDQQDMPRVARRMADDADADEHGRQQPARREVEQPLDECIDESRVLRDAEAQKSDQDQAEGWEIDEGLDHFAEKGHERLAGQLIFDLNRLLRLARSFRPGIFLAKGDRRQASRSHPGYNKSQQKQRRRIGQLVAEPLDRVERALGPGPSHGRLRFRLAVVFLGHRPSPRSTTGVSIAKGLPISGPRHGSRYVSK